MKSDRSGHVQYACLPWRDNDGQREIMLITSRGTGRWVLPKGWPMVGVPNDESAAQEALEEAGVRGTLGSAIGSYHYDKQLKDGSERWLEVQVFPLEVTDELEAWKEERERTRTWFSCALAAANVGEPELSDLIAQFADRSTQDDG